MFGKRFRLFTILGFEIRLDASWFFLAILVTWTLAAGYFPEEIPGAKSHVYWLMGIAGTLGLVASIVLHELSHAIVARRNGLPMGGITLFIFGGVAEMDREPPNARTEFLMAVAGPIASAAIGALLLGVLAVSDAWPRAGAAVMAYLGTINLVLAAFNLLPAFPLDGGRMLRAYLWHRRGDLTSATRTASRIGSGFGLGLMVLGAMAFLTGGVAAGIWYFVLGLFLRGLAASSYQQVLLRGTLGGEPVRRFMSAEPVSVSPDTSIEELVEDYIYRRHHKLYPVVDQGRLAGCITLEHIKAIPREEWATRRVGDTAVPCAPANTIEADADAFDALRRMRRSGVSRLMVATRGRLEGVVTLKDLLEFVTLRLELERG